MFLVRQARTSRAASAHLLGADPALVAAPPALQPPSGLLEGFRNWWRGWTTAAPLRPPAARPKPSALRESRKGTPGAVAVQLVWLPAPVAADSAPALFDRLLLVAAVSCGLLWLMQSRGSRQKDDA